METYQYRHITSADANTTVIVTPDSSVLHAVVINTTSAQALTLNDARTNGQSSTVAVLKASITENSYFFDADCANGIKVVVPTGYTGSATILFKQF